MPVDVLFSFALFCLFVFILCVCLYVCLVLLYFIIIFFNVKEVPISSCVISRNILVTMHFWPSKTNSSHKALRHLTTFRYTLARK